MLGIYEFRLSIAVKFCIMITFKLNFITRVQKFVESSPKTFGEWAKTCKISRDFGQLQTSIAISRTDEDIQHRTSIYKPILYRPRFLPRGL